VTIYANDDNATYVADVYRNYVGSDRVTEEELAANARLIAAAPELLEALELAVACGMVPTSSAMEGGACAYSIQAQVADKIRAAIAKATGAAIPEEGE
jgi:hypothetical protein